MYCVRAHAEKYYIVIVTNLKLPKGRYGAQGTKASVGGLGVTPPPSPSVGEQLLSEGFSTLVAVQ